jgi:hypothetical protein
MPYAYYARACRQTPTTRKTNAPRVIENTRDVFTDMGAPPYIRPPLLPKVYTFPNTLQAAILTSEQQKEQYGIPKDDTPAALRGEIGAYTRWSQEDINLSRDFKYSHAVQSSTIDGQAKNIRGFMGYTMGYFNVPPGDVSLAYYKDPQVFASFISYLRARGVTRGPLLAHTGESLGG